MMPLPAYAVETIPYRAVLEDRAIVVEVGEAVIVGVADGAGGMSFGDRAAEKLVVDLRAALDLGLRLEDTEAWIAFLAGEDASLHHEADCGQTTAVVLAITSRHICGASVGDSEAWLVSPHSCRVLTSAQRRKPFIGSGCARPTPFRIAREPGMMVVATDGLFKYADAARISEAVRGRSPGEAIRSLVNLVRLPSGQLWDDLGIVVLDLSPPLE